MRTSVERRIQYALQKYTIEKDVNSCWDWSGPKTSDGYGFFQLRKGAERLSVRAHRAVYEARIGQIPPGLILMHLCNNPSCCNPGHLKPATYKENNNHTDEQGRRPSFYGKGKRGISGISFHRSRQKWRAIDNQNNQLYWGSDYFEACCARKSWEASLV